MSTSFIFRSRFLLATLIFSGFLLPLLSFAQSGEAVPVSEEQNLTEQMTLVADVNIHGGGVVENLPREVTVGFSIMSSLGLQEGVRYGLILLEKEDQVELDQYVTDEVLTLTQGEYVYREFTYVAPATVAAGDYELSVVSQNQTGVPLATYSLGTVTFSESQIDAEVVTESCSFDKITDGEIECVVANTSNIEKEVTIEVQITAGDLFGQKVGTLFTTNVAVPANSSVSYTLPSYAEDKLGGAYTLNSQIFIQGRQLLDRNIYTERFGTINPSISNLFVLEGEEPVLGVVVVSAPAGTFVNIAPTSKSELCALTRADIESARTDVTLSSGCKGSTMAVSLMGADGSVFDIQEVYLKGAPETEMTYSEIQPVGKLFFVMVIIIGLTMMWLLMILLRRNRSTTMVLMLLILPLLALGTSFHQAEAATATAQKVYQCVNKNASGCDNSTEFYTANAYFVGPNSVAPGAEYEVSATISSGKADTNSWTGIEAGAAPTCPPGNGAAAGCAGNDRSNLVGSFGTVSGSTADNGVSLGTRSFSAPTTPGTYILGFWAFLTGVPEFEYNATMSYGSMSFTVIAPQCSDGVDNGDGDGLADANDPNCFSTCVATGSTGSASFLPNEREDRVCTPAPTVTLTPRQS